jgi:hypothetical protein
MAGGRAPSGMRRFVMERVEDVSGVSGTGSVLEGVLFSTGVVVIHWLTPPPRGSISVFESFDQFLTIHVLPHPDNRTRIVFEDGEVVTASEFADGALRQLTGAGVADLWADPGVSAGPGDARAP